MTEVSGRVLVYLRESTNRVRQTASKMRRALRQQRDSDKSNAGQEGIDVAHKQAVGEKKTYLIIIGSTHKEQNQRTKNEVGVVGWCYGCVAQN